MHFNYHVKIVKRQTKLYTKILHAVAPFVLVGVAVSISSKVKIINFYTRPPSCCAIKILCTVISQDRALLKTKTEKC